MSIPTTPGPHWWREKDGDEWKIKQVYDDSRGNLYTVVLSKTIHVSHNGGQWANAHTPDELATLRAKAEAYDEGVERLAVYNGNGDFMWTDNYLEKPQKTDLPVGCHYRKVRVCEVVEQSNEKGER